MYVLDMFSDDDREFLGQIKNKTIQTEDKEAKAYDLSTLEKKFGTAVAYDAAFLKPAAMTRTDKEGKVHNLIRGKNGTYADKKEKETIEDKFKEILSYIDPDNSEVTATISTDGDTNVLRITHNGKTTEKTTPNLLKAVEYLEDMGLVKNESEVNEALFPGSELGNKLRNADSFMHDTELNKALGVGVGAGLTGSTAGVTMASSGGGIALFAPALGAGLLTGAMAVLGGVITYKTLKWLASKVFGTTEEALAFAKAHLAAAKQGAQQFEWNGKPYPVKVKDQKQIANLEIQINDLSSRVMNEGEFRDFPGSAKVAVPDDVVKGNINSIDNKIAKLKADMAKLIDRAHSGDQSARKQLAQIDAQRKLKEFAPDEGGGDEKQYLLQLADQMANAMYGPNKNAQATKDIKSKIVAAGGDVKISYNNDSTFNVVMYHPTYFKQGHLIRLVGNGDQVDESTKSVHRISLTVTDPNHAMVSKRKETIQKTVKVTSDNRDKAIKSAIAHYRKKGYKVHDHHYIGTGEHSVAKDQLNELDMFAPRTVYFKMADGNYIKADYRGSEGLGGHTAYDNVTFTSMSWVPPNTASTLGLDKFLAKGSDPDLGTAGQNAQGIVGTNSAGEGPFGNRTIDVVDFVNGKQDTVPLQLKTQVMQWVQKNQSKPQAPAQGVAEEWSQKYKNSINCSHPKGFSQRAHCAGKKKHNESVEMEMVCEDCGMCQTHGNLNEIKKGAKDSNGFTRCWPGKHAVGTKKGKNGGQVRNCKPNEGVAEGSEEDMSKEVKAMATGTCPHCHGPVKKKEHPTLTQYHCAKCGIRGSIDKQGVAEGKGLAKKVKVVKGEHAGKTGWIREIKHGAFKGAPKTYYIDLDDGGQANNLPATALRLVKEQGVAEGVSNSSVISAIVKGITEKRPDLLKYGSDRVSDAINSVAGMVGNNAQGIESNNLNSWIKQVERILAQQIDEGKLTANDSPDTWIKRFQSSTHPNLSGKDPETLKKMALAARSRMLNKTPSLPKSKPVNGNYWWQDKNESAEPAKMSMRDYIKEADRLHDLMQHYDKIGDETNYQKAKAAYLELEDSARNGMIPEGEEIKSGRPRVRKVNIMRPDGSKGERFEVLNHSGVRVGPLFDDAKWAKEYLQRHYLKLINLDEEASSNPTDTVTMDVPMLLRVMEFAREDAKTDLDLHDVAEKLVNLSSNGNTLTMKDYDQVVPATNEPDTQEQPYEESKTETKNVVGGRYWDSAEKRWRDQE